MTSDWKLASVTCDDVLPGGRRRGLGGARGGFGSGLDRCEIDRAGHGGGQRRVGLLRSLLTAGPVAGTSSWAHTTIFSDVDTSHSIR